MNPPDPTFTKAKPVVLSGTVVPGSGRAAFFTQLDWVKAQCLFRLGFTPYPGTLNLRMEMPLPKVFSRLPVSASVSLTPPDETCCQSLAYPGKIGNIPCAILLPEERVRVHGSEVIEVIAPVFLREAINVGNGDRVSVELATNSTVKTRAVLFDLDGTLIDSVGIYYRMVEIVLNRLGLPLASREDISAAAEKDPFDWLRIFPETDHHRRETLIPAAWKIVEETYPVLFREKAGMIAGAAEIMRQIACGGIKIGIVTSTPRKHIQHKMRLLDHRDLTRLVAAIVTADDAARKKPAPDPLLTCAALLETPPAACVYVGDTGIDIRAGKAAGMKTVAVLTGFDAAETLSAENPDALIDTVGTIGDVLPFL